MSTWTVFDMEPTYFGKQSSLRWGLRTCEMSLVTLSLSWLLSKTPVQDHLCLCNSVYGAIVQPIVLRLAGQNTTAVINYLPGAEPHGLRPKRQRAHTCCRHDPDMSEVC